MDILSLQERFLSFLFDDDVGGDIKKAATKAGYAHPEANCHRIARALKDKIIERTKEYIALNGPKAAVAMSNVLEGPVLPGVKERLQAAKELLDRCGVVKSEELKIVTPGTIFYLPAKDSKDEEDG